MYSSSWNCHGCAHEQGSGGALLSDRGSEPPPRGRRLWRSHKSNIVVIGGMYAVWVKYLRHLKEYNDVGEIYKDTLFLDSALYLSFIQCHISVKTDREPGNSGGRNMY
jgi:hypothetical protein